MNLSLFPHHDPHPSIREAFTDFRLAHPEVERELVKLARLAKMRRPDQPVPGMKCLWEVLRWTFWLRDSADRGEPFKLNNNYTALYARRIMELYPDLRGAWETRKRSAA